MLDYLKNKRVLIISGIGVIIIIVLVLVFFGKDNSNTIDLIEEINVKENQEETNSNFYVDVKGAVKDPGVYLVNNGERVIDAIEKAGGLKKNANTSNINLSKRLESEMVIVVYTNNEIVKGSKKLDCDTKCNCEVIEINNCIESKESSTKININTATIDELMTLSGVGESKAKAIIAYREDNDGFKTVEELKEVSGIGDALFESIKDSVTI